MVEAIADMPPGTIGFRASGELTRDDYTQVLEPAIAAAVETGDVRMLYEVGPEFEHLTPGALWEDAKTGVSQIPGHLGAWKRTALVTDVGWIVNAMKLFAWMAPGEVAVFPRAELDQAKAWVAGDD